MEIINGYRAGYWRRLDRLQLRIAAALLALVAALTIYDWLQADDFKPAPLAGSQAPSPTPDGASGRVAELGNLSNPPPIGKASVGDAQTVAANMFEARWAGGKLHFYGHIKDYRQAEIVRQQAGVGLGLGDVEDTFVIDGVTEPGPWQAHVLAMTAWFRGKPDGAFVWQDNSVVLSGSVKTAAERSARADWVLKTFGSKVSLKNNITLVGEAPAPLATLALAGAPVLAPVASAVAPVQTAVVTPVAAPVVLAPAAVTTPAPQPVPQPAPQPILKPSPVPQAEVLAALQAWRSAWAASDVARYTGSYVADFKGDLASNAAWRQQRQQRIVGAGKITLDIDQVRVSGGATSGAATVPASARALAVFTQNYSSASLRQSGEKTLLLVKQNGRWLIEKESFRAQ